MCLACLAFVIRHTAILISPLLRDSVRIHCDAKIIKKDLKVEIKIFQKNISVEILRRISEHWKSVVATVAY